MNLDECKQNTLFISKQFLILVFLNILICLRCEVVVFGTKKFFDSKKDSKDEDINNDLFRNLKGRERMLLVLDDVWKIQTLEILEVMPKGVQCKIIITTRDEGVPNKKHATKLKMPILSPLESWKLFCHHACCGDVNMPLDLEEVGKQIMSECGGLPLALKVIGRYLAGSIEPSY